jgi:cell division protein FtsW
MMLGIFFLAGAPLIQFGMAFGAIFAAFVFLIVFSPDGFPFRPHPQ